MNSSLKKTLSFVLLSGTCISVKPISDTTAQVGSAVGGLLAGGAAGAVTYSLIGRNFNSTTTKVAISSLAGFAVGGLVWYALYQWLYSKTPAGRVAAAEAVLGRVMNDSLMAKQFLTPDELAAHITARFGTGWPLILGREQFLDISYSLGYARDLVGMAYQEASNDPFKKELCNRCLQLNQKIANLAHTVEEYLTTIIKNEKYDIQLKLYEKYMEAERQRHHDTEQRERDRLHDYGRDFVKYSHQDKILSQNPNRPITLNVG